MKAVASCSIISAAFLSCVELLAQAAREPAANGPTNVLPRESPHYLSTTWKTEQGLALNWIQCLLQTRDGYLWLGTPEGLIRFDGEPFLRLNHENCPAFRSEVVKALAEDAAGNLWVATKRGGALRFRPEGIDTFTAANGLGGDETTSLSPSRSGGLWIGTESGLSYFHQGRLRTFTDTNLPVQFIYSANRKS